VWRLELQEGERLVLRVMSCSRDADARSFVRVQLRQADES
jgi:hypothetical protein